MFKKVLSICLSFVMMFSFAVSVNAQNPDYSVMPCYEYTEENAETLTISNGTATCISRLTGILGTTTKIEITMTLEKKTLWWWSEEESWSQTYNYHQATLTKTHSVGSGTYRVKAVYVVYSGTQSETITSYSAEV